MALVAAIMLGTSGIFVEKVFSAQEEVEKALLGAKADRIISVARIINSKNPGDYIELNLSTEVKVKSSEKLILKKSEKVVEREHSLPLEEAQFTASVVCLQKTSSNIALSGGSC